MWSRAVENWWYVQRKKDERSRKKRGITWDNIPEPGEPIKFNWHYCARCQQYFPFIFHPDIGLGLIAHFPFCGKIPADGKPHGRYVK